MNKPKVAAQAVAAVITVAALVILALGFVPAASPPFEATTEGELSVTADAAGVRVETETFVLTSHMPKDFTDLAIGVGLGSGSDYFELGRLDFGALGAGQTARISTSMAVPLIEGLAALGTATEDGNGNITLPCYLNVKAGYLPGILTESLVGLELQIRATLTQTGTAAHSYDAAHGMLSVTGTSTSSSFYGQAVAAVIAQAAPGHSALDLTVTESSSGVTCHIVLQEAGNACSWSMTVSPGTAGEDPAAELQRAAAELGQLTFVSGTDTYTLTAAQAAALANTLAGLEEGAA